MLVDSETPNRHARTPYRPSRPNGVVVDPRVHVPRAIPRAGGGGGGRAQGVLVDPGTRPRGLWDPGPGGRAASGSAGLQDPEPTPPTRGASRRAHGVLVDPGPGGVRARGRSAGPRAPGLPAPRPPGPPVPRSPEPASPRPAPRAARKECWSTRGPGGSGPPGPPGPPGAPGLRDSGTPGLRARASPWRQHHQGSRRPDPDGRQPAGSAGRPRDLGPRAPRVETARTAGRPGPPDGKRSARACTPARARARRPSGPGIPPGKGVRVAGPRRRPRGPATAPADHPLHPRPSPGPGGPGEAGEGPARRPPQRAQTPRRCAPPPPPFPPTRALFPHRNHPQRAGRDGRLPRAGGGARDPPTALPGAGEERPRGGGAGGGRAGKRARERKGEGPPGRTRPAGRPDKPLCRGLTFNRSQRGSCSATYETPTQKQVVYEWFSTRFPTNVRCVTGEGAAPFPAAPRFPGRGALRTGPRSRRAAGHATPRGARAAARRRGRRGTGYPRPTEAPRRCRIVPPGRDSDLEAFSHNPTDGSFAPLAPQPSTYTKCLNLRFLSY